MLKAIYADLEKLSRDLTNKTLEIEKRREVIQKFRESEAQRKKIEVKKEKLSAKEEIEKLTLEKRIAYYHGEIKKAEEKFEAYRDYCLKQIEVCESKASLALQSIEVNKNSLDDIASDEDSDKTLTRLKKEKEQLEEQINYKNQRRILVAEQDRKNKMEEAAMMELMKRNEEAMNRAMTRDYAVEYTQSFYDAETKSEPSTDSSLPPSPKRSEELETKLQRQKEDRIKFKKSEIFSNLTSKEQQKYRELHPDNQDKIHQEKTIKGVKQLLKSIKAIDAEV